MKDLTTTPTAELLAEWGNLETKIADRKRFMMVNKSEQDDIDYLETHLAQRNAIAAELDRRCSEAGIYEHAGYLRMRTDHDNVEREDGWTKTKVTFMQSIEELRDLLTWLLLKGGKG